MVDPKREQALEALAAALRERELSNAARVFLDVVEPVAFLASQLALFVHPLTPRGQWQAYVDALTDEAAWSALRRKVER